MFILVRSFFLRVVVTLESGKRESHLPANRSRRESIVSSRKVSEIKLPNRLSHQVVNREYPTIHIFPKHKGNAGSGVTDCLMRLKRVGIVLDRTVGTGDSERRSVATNGWVENPGESTSGRFQTYSRFAIARYCPSGLKVRLKSFFGRCCIFFLHNFWLDRFLAKQYNFQTIRFSFIRFWQLVQ